jgi:poly [ADP-ribose] polymerase
VDQCIKDFNDKKRDKSVKGDYIVIEKDYTPKEDEGVIKKREEEAMKKSKLDSHIKSLISLIFDLKMMND